MNFYKEWRMLKWKFITILLIMVASAMIVVLTRNIAISALNSPQVQEYLKNSSKAMSQLLSEISTNFTYYSFTQWFGKSYIQLVAIFAAIMSFSSFSKEFSKKTIYLLAGRMSRWEIYISKTLTGYMAFAIIVASGGVAYYVTALLMGYHLQLQMILSWTFATTIGGLLLYQIGMYISILFKDQIKPLLLDIAVYVGLYITSMLKPTRFLNLFGYMAQNDLLRGKGINIFSTLIVCIICLLIFVGGYFQFKFKDL